MKANLTYPVTLSFSFKKAVIENGKSYMNTYKIKGLITVASKEELTEVSNQIAKKFTVNITNIDYDIV